MNNLNLRQIVANVNEFAKIMDKYAIQYVVIDDNEMIVGLVEGTEVSQEDLDHLDKINAYNQMSEHIWIKNL